MYLLMGDLKRDRSLEEAIALYENALYHAEAIRGNTVVMKAHARLAECHALLGQYEDAFLHQSAYQQLYESRNIGLEARLAEQELVHASEQYDQELALLNTQQELSTLTSNRQRTQRNTLIGISVLLLVVVAIIYYQLRQNRKARQLLQSQKDIIDQSLSDKEVLLREIHHRVKNNLQIVSSMLHLQGRHVKDPGILDALRDSRNRVNSMALIHQSLYREDHLKGINVREYLQALTQSLATSYRVDEEQIRITTDVQNILLDVDSAIPIGLITNELLTNAIKYAFPRSEKGEIHMRLEYEGGLLHLSVKDNGIGLPESFDIHSQESYGYHLVHSLARKLKADVRIRNSTGCAVSLHIKQFKILSP